MGGLKIFRDLIWQMQGRMRADHRFYKEHGFYNFPQKNRGKMLAMYLVGTIINNRKMQRKLGGKLTDGMLGSCRKVLEQGKSEITATCSKLRVQIGDEHMMYPYMTLNDETEIVHSQIIDEGKTEKVLVHFERPTENGFDSARCELPSYTWIFREGYTDQEISFFEQLRKVMLI